MGLVKALERFDLERDVELLAYVFPTIVGELKRHFRDRVWAVTVPRRLKELHLLLSRRIQELTATLGRSPTIAGLSTHFHRATTGDHRVMAATGVPGAPKSKPGSDSR